MNNSTTIRPDLITRQTFDKSTLNKETDSAKYLRKRENQTTFTTKNKSKPKSKSKFVRFFIKGEPNKEYQLKDFYQIAEKQIFGENKYLN